MLLYLADSRSSYSLGMSDSPRITVPMDNGSLVSRTLKPAPPRAAAGFFLDLAEVPLTGGFMKFVRLALPGAESRPEQELIGEVSARPGRQNGPRWGHPDGGALPIEYRDAFI